MPSPIAPETTNPASKPKSHEIKCPNCGTVFEVDEAQYASIAQQIRDAEFQAALAEQHAAAEREKQSAVALAKAQAAKALSEAKSQAETLAKEAEYRAKTAVAEAQVKSSEEISQLRLQLTRAEDQKKLLEENHKLEQKTLKESYEAQLKSREDEITRIKDMKSKLSTKMIGESLEQFCQNEFNKLRATAFPNAYFEKDNAVSASGSKGDFIFRDPAEGIESISIMFEMKNEAETTATKHKNEDFFAELDKDRREKNCEYAVLVSLLEADSDLYNQGIVDVSYRFPKMYVIRPQFFIPMITLLKNAAEKSLAVKHELALVRNQNIDITNFENDVEAWKSGWLATMQKAGKKHSEAIEQINKAIKDLEKVRDALTLSDKHLIAAENKMDDLTIKRLTRNNPTMRAKFDDLKNAQEAETAD